MHNLSYFEVTEMEKLEAEILKTITYINKVAGLVRPLQDELMRHRAKLCNLISAYKTHRTEAEIDDLLFAIIRDDALSLDDIQVVFDYTDQDLAGAIKRMNERR